MTAPDLPAIEARADVWRVVERSGAVHGLRVEASQCPIFDARFAFVALSTDTIGGFWSGPSPMGAVAAYAESSRWDVVAILAPGEPTRADLTAERDALAARLAALRVAATLVRDAQAVAAAAKARYEATWGTADGAPVRTDAEKITAALTAWHVAGDALDTALGALVADATGRPCAWPVAP